MPVTQGAPAPYAPPATILDLIARFRDRGMASPFTPDVLTRAGVADSLLNRVRQSLRTLDLVDADDCPTEVLTGLANAPEDELKPRMAEWLQATYADVFRFANPATDDEVRIRDAFRTYEPRGQQDRMVTLFLGLCEAAGIRSRESNVASGAPRPRSTQRQAAASHRRREVPDRARREQPKVDGVPQPIAGLLASLPANRRWTKKQRDNFLRTFEAVVDFCFEVSNEVDKEADDDEEGR